MRIIIIGNGVAGVFSAQNIRTNNKEAEIEIISEEKYPYYTRIKLPELISEKLSIDDLIVNKEDWYITKNIKQRLETKVKSIHPKNKHIILEREQEPLSYDKLIIATGSKPNIPPIENASNMIGKGVFTLRNMNDALEIHNYIRTKSVNKAIIIGGGLLGLELAKQIRNCNLETTVVEYFPRLLPRQLDTDCSGMLREVIEDMGIKIELDVTTEEILGNDVVEGIKIKEGRVIKADIVLIQTGIRPIIDLAKEAKMDTNRGIIVNEHLETSVKDVYAVGDCIEYKNQTWGIIPACIEQSKIVANSVLDKKGNDYQGTVPKNTLKIIGIDLTSIGIFDPEDKHLVGAGWKILKNLDEKGKCYKKIVLKDNMIKGAIFFGDKKSVPYISRNIEHVVQEKELREAIELYKWKCGGCGHIYDDTKRQSLFKNLPEEWHCKCGAPKNKFIKLE